MASAEVGLFAFALAPPRVNSESTIFAPCGDEIASDIETFDAFRLDVAQGLTRQKYLGWWDREARTRHKEGELHIVSSD